MRSFFSQRTWHPEKANIPSAHPPMPKVQWLIADYPKLGSPDGHLPECQATWDLFLSITF